MNRLPIRVKLTLAFAGVMAIVLVGIGTLLYLRFDRELDKSLDDSLHQRAGEVSALVRETDAGDSGLSETGQSRLTEADESFAQIFDERGRAVDATGGLRDRRLLTPEEVDRARGETITLDRESVFEPGEPTRLLATPVQADGRRLVVVVGASREDNEEALQKLLALLLIGGPVALLLASVAGYGVAAAALRPVEAMRRRADEISDAEPGRRLPVPEADDEIARLGDTLNVMLARLEAAFERERTFVSDASHELRTPLAILKAELELALRAGRSREELQGALRSAAEETDRLAQLADDLLTIARSDRGGLPVRPDAIDAGDVLRTVRDRFARRAAGSGRTIEVDGGSGTEIFADRARVEQALSSVVDNALRHGEGATRLSARRTGARIELHVRDQGPGFPPSFLPHAFERFARADEGRTEGGTGLGLAIVDVIARAHGGVARATNGADGGADVWIELPAERTAPA